MEQKDTPPLLQSSLLLLETKKVCVIGTTLSFRTEPNRMEQRCNNGDGEGWPTKRWWNWFFISHSLGARQLMSYGGLTTEISLDDHELPACCYARGDKAIFFFVLRNSYFCPKKQQVRADSWPLQMESPDFGADCSQVDTETMRVRISFFW